MKSDEERTENTTGTNDDTVPEDKTDAGGDEYGEKGVSLFENDEAGGFHRGRGVNVE